jgi:hypothetical protein
MEDRMRRILAATLILMISAPAMAQTAVGVGVGTARSASTSTARATAIGGGSATGGAAIATGGNVTIGASPATTTNTTTTNGSLSTVPNVFAPGLTSAALETCLGSVSGGGSWLGTGITLGGTIPDPSCTARLDARTLWSFGLKKAAVARLCASVDIYNSMPDVCTIYLPRPVAAGSVVSVTSRTEYVGGPIELVDGRTGLQRTCNDYNVARQRCRQWATETAVVAAQRR